MKAKEVKEKIVSMGTTDAEYACDMAEEEGEVYECRQDFIRYVFDDDSILDIFIVDPSEVVEMKVYEFLEDDNVD